MAYDLPDWLSIGGTFSGSYQCQSVSGSRTRPVIAAELAKIEEKRRGKATKLDEIELKPEFFRRQPDGCRGAVLARPEISIKPNARNEFFAKAGFAEGDGLNKISPFVEATWAADLESDLEDINGRGRDHLLTAWYKRTIEIGPDNSLSVTGGIIDATNYLDENAYANDEYNQFMNATLTNGPIAFVPYYDWGGAVQWDIDKWSVRGVMMNVGKNEDDETYNFYGVEVDRKIETRLGEGTYRILAAGADKKFLDPAGRDKQRRAALLFSFDQELGETFGVWTRFGWQTKKAKVKFDALYSGGIDVRGHRWGREDDNIGIGYAYLNGGNIEFSGTHVFEAYYRLGLGEYFSLTADAQYMKDNKREKTSPEGWIFSLRGTVEY